MSEYAVVLERADDGGWWAYAPDLPGVVSTGDTPAEAKAGFGEALGMYSEELERDGSPLPAPRSQTTVVSI